jgi:hypothetical protein
VTPLPRHLQNQRPEVRLVPPPEELKPQGYYNRVTVGDVVLLTALILGCAGFLLAVLCFAGWGPLERWLAVLSPLVS